MKKFLTVICLLLLFAIVFAGCTKKEPTKSPDISAAPTADPKVFTDGTKGVVPDENKKMQVNVVDEGYDIYAYTEGQDWGYRYGPSMMVYPDGSMDAWFAAPGSGGEWDWFTYRHSDDSGKTWTDEVVALQPTADSMDYYSVCDPGSIYFNGYYYLGYTSTIYIEGVCNNGFVARSKNPQGPYEKWNGSGWGGKAAPIVYYTGDKTGWGVGEMSFVVVEDKLYVYYTWKNGPTNTTRVSVADAKNENWPATMEYKGVAMKYTSGTEDSADVKYVEDYGKFIAINTGDRMGPNSYVGIWESNDGITFTKTNKLYTNIIFYCHNAGFMSRPDGHINLKDKLYFGYAYGGSSNKWGRWNTRVHEFTLSLVDEIDPAEAKAKNNKKIDVEHWPVKELWTVGITTNPHHYEKKLSAGEFTIDLRSIDTYFETTQITDASKVQFSDYDEKVISFNGLTCVPKALGETFVTVKYDGQQNIFLVTILDDNAKVNLEKPVVVGLKSCFAYPGDGPAKISETGALTISLSNKSDKVQIRALATFNDRNWMELFNDRSDTAPYDADDYKVVYKVADESIIRVDKKGIITAKAVGKTTVNVSLNEFSYDVEVNIVD